MDPVSGVCSQCGASLERAILREIRHYKETRLMQVTCAACEESFFAVATETPRANAISLDEVIVAARALDQARSLSQLFGRGSPPRSRPSLRARHADRPPTVDPRAGGATTTM